MTPARAAALEQIIQRLWDDLHIVCEGLDETYVTLLAEKSEDAPSLRTVITHLKDARAAIERANGAIQ